MTARRLAALTGATGFLGRRLAVALAAEGFCVRILARRDPAGFPDLGEPPEVVLGDLDDAPALHRLCDGAEVLVHSAALTKAMNLAAFMHCNAAGAGRAAEAAAANDARLVLVSSLAARQPELSAYAASKRAGEAAAAQAIAPERLTVVRPPAIYGPGDREFLPLFRFAAGPVIPLLGPPGSRLALIHVDDAARAIADLAARPRPGVYALADQTPGYTWHDVVAAAAQAAGGRPAAVQLPPPVLHAAGAVADLASRLTGRPAVFSSGKVREILHGDWSVAAHERPPGSPPPRHDLASGFADVVHAARAARLM